MTSEAVGTGRHSEVLSEERAGDVDALPCSLAQQRMWLLEQLGDEATSYNVAFPLKFTGRFDRAAAAHAVTELVRRHEMLRTTFEQRDGQLLQLIHPAGPVELRGPVDLSGERDPAASLDARLQASLAELFDLRREVIRFVTYRLGHDVHVLVAVVDHMVCDAWSGTVLIRDIAELYQAHVAGRTPNLPELAVQYADYGEWHREWIAGETSERQLRYWRRELSEPPPRITLPARTSRGQRRSSSYLGTIPDDLGQRLGLWAQGQNCPLAGVLFAGFSALLARYAGQQQLLIGTLVANRPRPELENLIGFFTNTVVLRADLDGDPTVEELIGRARTTWLDAQLNQDVPFDDVVKELKPSRSPDQQQPFFDVMFQVVESNPADLTGGDCAIELVEPQSPAAPVDLELAVFAVGHALSTVWDFDAGLLSEQVVEGMHRHFLRLLDSMLSQPGARLSELSMLSEAEQAALLRGSGVTDPGSGVTGSGPSTAGPLAHSYFQEQAARQPDAPALGTEHQHLSYGQADARANRLARLLLAAGVGPGQPVAVCLPPGADLAISFLAVLKAGAVYVPIDPSYPEERISRVLAAAAPAVVIADAGSAVPSPGAGVRIIVEAESQAELADLPGTAPELSSTPADTAYVIFTSGSTGVPKAVAVSHRGVATIVAEQRRLFELGPHDVMLQHASPGFDASVFEMLMAFGAGARLHAAASGSDRADLGRTLMENRITAATVSPSALVGVTADQVRNVRVLTVAGEQCPRAVAERLAPGRRFFNLYGPTEATIWSTVFEVDGADRGEGPVPIGRPVTGVRCYVLDPMGNLVPPGVWGELVIGGPSVALGYLGQQRLSAAKFRPDPWGEDGDRVYLSGDRARWDSSGDLEFGGRLDRQVKLRGHRIEPGDVESALLEHPAVQQALVLVSEQDAAGSGRLLAFVACASGVEPAELSAWCEARLPGFMVPTSIHAHAAFPLNSHGKIDQAALLALAGQQEEAPAADLPRPGLEEFIASVWAELLSREQISRSSNFFQLGGHSLLATLLVTRLRDELDIDIPVRALFDNPTVAGFADALVVIESRADQLSR
ncbi:non-ribosomal peptide synthetase [Jatrophihabitans sp.]|jgi:amino acid adenylation domain-containing protein|uniref:non-ribosomal peptide synthetase n=1 Tax=Jatrophihabitans sp. TaxID=1932789 RepID=UPI002EE2511E